jgi:adenylosuccinate lyase
VGWWATNPKIDVPAIDAIEAVTKHDVIAFLDLGGGAGRRRAMSKARFMHQGMTSSDVLDTCLAVQLARRATCCWPTLDACSPRSSAAR